MRQGATITRKLKVTKVEGRVILDGGIFERTYTIRGDLDPFSAERFIRTRNGIPFIADMCHSEEHSYTMDVQNFIDNADSVDGVPTSQLTLTEQEIEHD